MPGLLTGEIQYILLWISDCILSLTFLFFMFSFFVLIFWFRLLQFEFCFSQNTVVEIWQFENITSASLLSLSFTPEETHVVACFSSDLSPSPALNLVGSAVQQSRVQPPGSLNATGDAGNSAPHVWRGCVLLSSPPYTHMQSHWMSLLWGTVFVSEFCLLEVKIGNLESLMFNV